MKKVLAFGTFDVVHPGHVFFFRECKKLGDHLTVVIARDSTVIEVKGKAPRFDEETRRVAVQSISEVDKAVLGDPTDKYKIIKMVKPDVICLGYDQKVFVDKIESKLKEFGLHPVVVRIGSFKPEMFKSNLIREKSTGPVYSP